MKLKTTTQLFANLPNGNSYSLNLVSTNFFKILIFSLFIIAYNKAAAQTAQSLPYSFSSGSASVTSVNGWVQSGLGTDYADATTNLKFDTQSDVATLYISCIPGTLTYYLKGNGSPWSGVFTIQESLNGTSWTTLRTVTSLSSSNAQFTDSPLSTSRYFRWIYTTKTSGNIGMGTINITAGVATPSQPGSISGTSVQAFNATSQTYSVSTVANASTYSWSVPSGWTISSGSGTNSIAVSVGCSAVSGNISVTAANSCGNSSSAQTLAVTVSGNTRYYVANNGWASTSSWSATSGGSAGASVPVCGDNVVMSLTGTYNVSGVTTTTLGTFTVNSSCNPTLQSSAGTATLTLSGTNALLVNTSSSLTLFANNTPTSVAIAFSSGSTATVDGGLTLVSSGSISNINLANCVLTIGSAGSLSAPTGATSNISNASVSTLFVNGTYNHTGNGGVIPTATWASTSNCSISGSAGSSPNGFGQTFGNLTISSGNSTAQPVQTEANCIVAGNLSVSSGFFTIGSNFTFSVTGTSSISGTFTLAGTGAKTFTDNVTINSGGVFNETGIATINFGGNLTNSSGTFTPSTGTHNFNSTDAQTINGTAFTIANVTFSGGGGKTLNTPLTVSSVLTLTLGVVTTTSTNILSVTSTATGAVTGTGSSSNMINGPLRRSMTSSTTYIFPVGNGGNCFPLTLSSVSGSGPIATVQAFNSASGGSTTDGFLSSSEYWQIDWAGTSVTAATVKLDRAAVIGSMSLVGTSSTVTGSYSSLGGTISGTSITAATSVGTVTSSTKYYSMIQGYCVPSGGTASGITGVVFNTINNTGTGLNSYTNYSSTISTNVIKGASYDINVYVNTGGGYTNYQKVWIDWNGNGSFNNTAGSSNGLGEEYTLGTINGVTNGLSSLCPLSITIPTGAITGSVRMRVVSKYTSYATSCQTGIDGEFEDYLITILEPSLPTITSFTPSSGCSSTGTITITGTNFTGTPTVSIGGTAATNVVVNSSTSITATVGNGTTGTVSVTTGGGTATSSSTFTVNNSPAAPTASAQSFCSGNSPTVNSLVATGTSINWYTASSGGSALVPSTSLVNATTYYATQTVGGCESATRTGALVTIVTSVSGVTASTSAATICNGNSVNLTSNSTSSSPSTLVSQSFATSSMPSGWSKVVGSGDGITITNTSSAGGSPYEVEFDGASQSTVKTNRLILGPINTSGQSSLTLAWKNYLYHYSSGWAYSVAVQTSTDNSTWTNTSWVTNPVTSTMNASTQSITINTADVGSSNLYISFTLSGLTFGIFNWYIDDVVLSGVASNSYTWTSSPAGYTSSSQNPIGVSPNQTTTYTVSASNGNGCPTTATTTVTVNNPTIPVGVTVASGDAVWTGASSGEYGLASNWLGYNGSNYSVPGSGPSTSTNVIIPATGTCVINNPSSASTIYAKDVKIAGVLALNSGSILNVSGDWINNGTLTANSASSVVFNGSSAQTISGSNNSIFGNLTLNNSAGLIVSKGITVNTVLTFTAGNITAASSSEAVTFETSGTASGAADTKCIVGYCKKNTNSTTKFTFPIGTSTLYRQASVTPSSSSATTWTTKYFGAGYGTYTVTGGSIYQPSKREYWTIDRSGVSASDATIELSWGSNSNVYAPNTSDLIVAHFNGTAWENAGGNSISGSTTGVVSSNAGWSSYSPFTLGSQQYAVTLPITLVSFDAKPYQNDVKVSWQTASEVDNDYFTVERSENGVDFFDLSRVDGAGNSAHTINYFTMDTDFNRTVLYYRLKLTSFNGEESFSDIASVDMSQTQNQGVIIMTVNSLGQEVDETAKGIVFDIYSDGTSVKRIQF